MLSPSRLFFGRDEHAEGWSTSVLDLLQDSDAEKTDDGPGEAAEDGRLPAGDMPYQGFGARRPPGLPLLSTPSPSFGSFQGKSTRPPIPPDLIYVGSQQAETDAGDETESDEDADDELGPKAEMFIQAAMPGSNLGDEPGVLPSIGSASHFQGNCDRCCFHPKGRCVNGFNCQHCHFDHEKRKRKGKKKTEPDAMVSKTMMSLDCLGTDEALELQSTSCEGSMPVSPSMAFGSSTMTTPVSVTSMPTALGMGSATVWSTSPTHSSPHRITDGAISRGVSLGVALRGSCEYLGTAPPRENEEYIRHLEAENCYLRSCLEQCMGPAAGRLWSVPPAHRFGVPACLEQSEKRLSPSAAPFWPSGQIQASTR